MTGPHTIETEPGLVFDVLADGPADAPLVLLLHGFAESFDMWRAQLPALAAAGYRAVAPSQRGYSAGARPPTSELANYHFDKLVADALAIAATCGHGSGRFHLVGHDWGAGIAWGIADRHADRVASLTVVSRPHPNAFNRALFMPDGEQAQRSRHHKAFLEPDAASKVLADDARWLRERWAKSGVSAAAAGDYLSVLGNAPAMEAALTWYRSRGAIRAPLGTVTVPVLYIWGDADDTVGRIAAEGTRDFVSGPYRFEALPGVGHFAVDQAGERVTKLLLAHLASHPV
ncbi:MAG TPA: alpha/beta hydrolase [Pseudolabrys sp.]|nr:alpha/beta hydrolase [Pseudolabrys sp.]